MFSLKERPQLDQISASGEATLQFPIRLKDKIDLYVIGVTAKKNVVASSIANNMRIQFYIALHAVKSLFKGIHHIAQIEIPGNHPAVRLADRYLREKGLSKVTEFFAWGSNSIYQIL